MSGLASFLLFNGYNVSGSDIADSEMIAELILNGLNFFSSHNESNINSEIDLIVYSGAIKDNNPELVKAKELKIKVVERSEFLGVLSKLFKNCIAISGTHGKTTTTALLSKIFMQTNLKPTIAIGGVMVDSSNFIIGKNDYFICEACEYRESFKFLKCQNAIITNIEADHLDYYKTFENVQKAFYNFAKRVKCKVVTYKENLLKEKFKKKVINCGDSCYYEYSYKILEKSNDSTIFQVFNYSKSLGQYKILMPQEYNVKNALLAIVMAKQFKIDDEYIKKGLLSFKGVERRNEKIGEINGVPVVADYAHHPSEIKESLKGVKEQFGKVLCVFQPHTYSRTKTLINEFKSCFEVADEVCFFKTYPAREPYDEKGCERIIFENCNNMIKKLFYKEQELFEYIKDNAIHFNAILVLGAGDLYNIIKKMLIK